MIINTEYYQERKRQRSLSFTHYGANETPGEQIITLGGSADLRAAVFAPNASLKLNGGGGSGAFFGAALVYDIKFTGTYVFHFDEALNNFYGANPNIKWRVGLN